MYYSKDYRSSYSFYSYVLIYNSSLYKIIPLKSKVDQMIYLWIQLNKFHKIKLEMVLRIKRSI